MKFSLGFMFIFALIMVGISLLSVIFPGLLLHQFGSITTDEYGAFEIGNNAILLIVSNIILISFGYVYRKNKLTSLSSFVSKIRDFDISKKYSLIAGIIIIIVYVAFTYAELSIDESTQWADYGILIAGLETFPETNSGDIIVDEQNSRFVRMLLLGFSQDYLNNIKIIPFVSSIVLIVITGMIAVEISNKRIAGLVSMLILIQGYTFLEYDTIAVYENLWVTFFLLSIYTIHKKWHFSGIFYLLSVFSKAFSTPFLILNAYYVLNSENNRSTKIKILISYVIIIFLTLGLFSIGNTIYDDIIQIDPIRFINSLSDFSSQMRFDSILLILIMPVTIGLFFAARNGIRHAESMLFFIPSLLLAGPLVALLTDFYVILPYRFIPLIVFLSISIGIVIFNKTKSS
ncbi:hypothetical protein OAJ67_00160 [Candidatus Nitrosopelagicus sp.]|nr:hypothetical protein [Candidatus Nitrosopelagicus sp.]